MARPGPTLKQRRLNSDAQKVGPFIYGLVSTGIAGMMSIALIVLFVRPVESAVVAAGLIITFCGTIIAGILTLTKVSEVKSRMDGRLDQLLEITSQQQYAAGIAAGEKQERAANGRPACNYPGHTRETCPEGDTCPRNECELPREGPGG